jgi:hypothetical protein
MFNPNDIIDENFLTPIPIELLKITDWYATQLNNKTAFLVQVLSGQRKIESLEELEKDDTDDQRLNEIINSQNRNRAEQRKAEIYFRKPTNMKDMTQMNWAILQLREIYSLKLSVSNKIAKYQYLESQETDPAKKRYFSMMLNSYRREYSKVTEHKPMLYPQINMILDKLKLEIVSSIFSASTTRQSVEQSQTLPYQDNSLNAQREIRWEK